MKTSGPAEALHRKTLSSALMLASALTGSLALVPSMTTLALAAGSTNVTTTASDTSAGSIRSAAQDPADFQVFVLQDLGSGAVINLAGPLTFTHAAAVALRFGGTTTSVSIGGDTISSANHLYFQLNNSSYTLTLNSDINFTGVGDLALVQGGTITFNGNISDVGTLQVTSNGTAVIGTTTVPARFDINSGGTIRFATAGTYSSNLEIENTATIDTGAHNVSISGAVTDDGTNVLVKTGSGTLTLSGTNTASGTMRIDAGTLSIAADGNLSAGALTFNGGNLTITGATTIDNAMIFSSNGTITSGANATLSGVLSGTGALTKSGAGTLILTGANTNSGGATISGGTLQIGNGGASGSLTGNVTNNSAISFNRSDTLSYSGMISGTGSLTKSGAGTLILTGGNTHSGGTTISAGTLQIGNGGTTGSLSGDIINNSALVFNRSDALTYAGVMSGTGSLTKSGAGTLTLTGTNTHTGGTTISAGKLLVNGSIGSVTLNGGTVGGSGTIGGLTANSGSTIAPGNSIGTLNVTGNAGFAAGSTYAVEVDRTGNADKIAATGTVTIDSGATVNVSPVNGTDTGSTYAASTTYTILTAGGGLTGTFGSVTENFAFLDASLSYDASNAYLKLLRNDFTFASVAGTANQTAAATGLDTLASGNAVHDAVISLSAASARAAFDSLSGEIHASAAGLFIEDSRFARTAVGNRIRDAFEGIASGNRQVMSSGGLGGVPNAGSVWGHAYGNWGRLGGNGNAAAMDYSTSGFLFGADAEIGGGWRGGLMAGYGHAAFGVGARASSGQADSYTFGAYAGQKFGALGLRLGASYALHDLSTNRSVTAGTLRNALSANYAATTAQVFGEAGYLFDTGGGRFEPFAGFALIHQRNPAFTETGGAAALSVAAASQTFGVITLGARAERQVASGATYTAALGGSLGWSHIIGDPGPSSTMRFAGGNAFHISGAPLDRDTAQIEAGLKLDFNNRASFDLKYNGALGARTQSHTVAARFAKTF